MKDDRITAERMAAIFLLGVVLFTPPMLLLFASDRFVLGTPLLFLYLFLAWGALIALLAFVIEQRGDSGDRGTVLRDEPTESTKEWQESSRAGSS